MTREQHNVLCVDDETSILNSLNRLLRKEDYKLLTATSGAEALSIIDKYGASLVISDQRMPGGSGIELLANVKDKYPDTIRVLLSGYTDIDTITDSVNKGHIYKLILKPWNDQNLILEIRQSLKQYELIQTNNALHITVTEQNKELKVINENLESLVNMRTKDLEIQNKALLLSRVILEEIPFPIIGVSNEMIIVYKNKKTSILSDHNNFCICSETSDSFSEEVEEKIRSALETNMPVSADNCMFSGKKYNLFICPLSEYFKGNGVVITFVECP